MTKQYSDPTQTPRVRVCIDGTEGGIVFPNLAEAEDLFDHLNQTGWDTFMEFENIELKGGWQSWHPANNEKMMTADGYPIEHGMYFWTNDLTIGRVNLKADAYIRGMLVNPDFDGWVRVETIDPDNGKSLGYVHLNGERLARYNNGINAASVARKFNLRSEGE